METSQIVIAVIAACGGGFFGSFAQQWLANRNAEKEREFQAKQRELEFANQEARRKEERYFNIKFKRYDSLLKALIPCIEVDCSEQDWIKLRAELVDSLPFMPNEPRCLFLEISHAPASRHLAAECLRKCIVAELEILHFSNDSREELNAELKKIIKSYEVWVKEGKKSGIIRSSSDKNQ